MSFFEIPCVVNALCWLVVVCIVSGFSIAAISHRLQKGLDPALLEKRVPPILAGVNIFIVLFFAGISLGLYLNYRCNSGLQSDEANSEDYNDMKLQRAEACSIEAVKCSESVLLLNGQIRKGQAGALVAAIRSELKLRPHVRILCLNSMGGEVNAALELASMIIEEGITTCLATKFVLSGDGTRTTHLMCNSMCDWIYLSGRRKISFGSGAKIGIHSNAARYWPCYSFGCRVKDEKSHWRVTELLTRAAVARGQSPVQSSSMTSLLSMAFEIPNERLDFVLASELKLKGLIDEILD